MKAGCSIVEKPEGGGGEQKLIISDGLQWFLFCPLGPCSQMADHG